MQPQIKSWIYIPCKKCSREVKVPIETYAVTCWKCVQSVLEPPKGHIDYDVTTGTFRKNEEEVGKRKPHNWKIMEEFVDYEGNYYCRGILQPHLQGTKSPTKIDDVPKSINKRVRIKIKKEDPEIKKNKLLIRMSKLKKQLKEETDSKKIKKLKENLLNISQEIKELN